MKHRTFILSMATALTGLACWQSGCRNEPERQATPLLAEARPDESNFSSYAPQNPYKEAGKNLLIRTVFASAGPAGTQIELRDLFVPPGTTAEKVSLPGPAILEVLGGEGKITTGENSKELAQGTSVSLAQDAVCSLESRGTSPLVLRARIFIP
jgi:hypothetical protein